MKELPATLLLRPLGFETLATHLYGEAARATHEDAAIVALLIVIVGLVRPLTEGSDPALTPKGSDPH
jgi:iron(III) transport system permease protein